MQKISLKEKIKEFSSKLKSKEIINSLKRMTSNQRESRAWVEDKKSLVQTIISSKSNYDNLVMNDSDLVKVSESLNSGIYSTENVTKIVTRITNTQQVNKDAFLTYTEILDLYLYHNTLASLNKIAAATITESQDHEEAIIFTLVSAENPRVNNVVEALELLQELIDIVEKIYDEEQDNRVYLLDKGSNTNIGIETGVKVAKSIFQIFKEVWDWMINRKYYKEKIRNASFVNNLDVIQKLSDMESSGALSNEDARRYKELLLKKTDELLSLNTVPRQLLLDKEKSQDDQLLMDYNEIRLLKNPKNADSELNDS